MKCIVEAAVHKGIGGLLAEFVPGGKYLHEVGADALKRHREKKAARKLEDDVKEMIAQKADDAIRDAVQAVEEAAPHLPRREKELLTQWVAGIPEAARVSMIRKDDSTGTSLPFGYSINSAEDVVKLLPQSPPRFAAGEWVPGRKDNWRLVKKLGGGGFGEVWLAKHEWKNEQRAVKFCTDPTARTRLVTHEKELIVRVMQHAGEHPNIVPLLECHLDGDAPWLMYDYVPGGTLADLMTAWAKLPAAERLSRALPLLHTIAGAVGHCHKMRIPIVHRDLKPANVLMDGDVPRITDFGIGGSAVSFLLGEQKRGFPSMTGSPLPSILSGSYSLRYASPQQQNGDPPDPRDDVHALGVLAYQMLMGDLSAVPGRDLDEDLADLQVPAALIALIGKSVSMKAERRPKDANEWGAVLVSLPRVTAPYKPLTEAEIGELIHYAASVAEANQKYLEGMAARAKPREPAEELQFPLPSGHVMTFCWIPPGTATLGSPKQEAMRASDEVEHDFITTGFWLAKYSVTQIEWHVLTGKKPSWFRVGGDGAEKVKGLDTDRFPVENVSWDMIYESGGFLEELNAIGGKLQWFGKPARFALPHEDQWEYACRGGKGNQQAFYWGSELNGAQANADGNHPYGTAKMGPSLGRPCPVDFTNNATYPVHPWGLCHIHGNAFEWCDNIDELDDNNRALRGGSWSDHAHFCRSAYRLNLPHDWYDKGIGLRILMHF